MQRYDRLLIDVHNIAHRVFDHKKMKPSTVSKKLVYKEAVANFIKAIDSLEEQFLHSDGEIYLLFDNPTSRIDLQNSFYYADRKDIYAKYKNNRLKEPKEFYNSINLLKFYYVVNKPKYRTVQISNLEADDLVFPVLNLYCHDKATLLVTNDLDWTRFISDKVHWLPNLEAEPEDAKSLSARFCFPWSTKAVVLYKALFGDQSDHIPRVIPESFKQQYAALEAEVVVPEDVMKLALSDSNIEKYPMLKYVRENQKQFMINLQLVNTIPLNESHVKAVTTIGRNSEISIKAVKLAVGLAQPAGFVFGNIKRPRETL